MVLGLTAWRGEGRGGGEGQGGSGGGGEGGARSNKCLGEGETLFVLFTSSISRGRRV